MPSARLWIVATPIGNIEDLSPRARSVLENADLILAEDTRRAGLLLSKIGIAKKTLLSFYEHNEAERQPEVLKALEDGLEVALITDAGTPLISDPGFKLIRECRVRKIEVTPVPGPSAPITALSAAGLPPIPFTFLGFLARSEAERRTTFKIYGATPASLLFFERKSRLSDTLQIAFEVLGNREVAICRELTKLHEEFILDRLENASAISKGLLGEITIIIGPPEHDFRTADDEIRQMALQSLATGIKPKQAAKIIKPYTKGWSTSEIYNFIQSFREI